MKKKMKNLEGRRGFFSKSKKFTLFVDGLN